MAKQPAHNTAFATYCRILSSMDKLKYSMQVSSDNLQALVKAKELQQDVAELVTRLENDIDKQNEKEL